MRRLNISIDENVADRIDAFADKAGLTRSALITVSCNTYIDAQEKIPELQEQIGLLQQELENLKKLK